MSERLPCRVYVLAQQYRRVPPRRFARPIPPVRGAAKALAGDRHRSIERRWGDWSNRRTPIADGRRIAPQRLVDGLPPGLPKRACVAWREDVAVRRRAARGRSGFGPVAGRSPPDGNERIAQCARWSQRRPSVRARSDRRTAASYRQCCLRAARRQAGLARSIARANWERRISPDEQREAASAPAASRINRRRTTFLSSGRVALQQRGAGLNRRRAVGKRDTRSPIKRLVRGFVSGLARAS